MPRNAAESALDSVSKRIKRLAFDNRFLNRESTPKELKNQQKIFYSLIALDVHQIKEIESFNASTPCPQTRTPRNCVEISIASEENYLRNFPLFP